MIVDGFFLLHTLKDIPRTFGDLSKKILLVLSKYDANRIDVIFDRYFCPSIKDTEHGLRGSVQFRDFHISGPQQVISSDFVKELKNMKFKEALVKFLIENWTEQEMARIICDKNINVNHDMCYQYTVENRTVKQSINEELTCLGHEEADTKIVYHVCQIAEESNVSIRCSDTDILIIMLGNMEFLKSPIKIWMDMGVGNSRRYINVSLLYDKLGSSLTKSLSDFHAMTECDYNPSLYRKGKTRPLTILTNSPRYQEAFAELGKRSLNQENVFRILQESTCRLYNEKKINDINLARLHIFEKTYKMKDVDMSKTFKIDLANYDACNLPPCYTELEQHLFRTRYITQLWSNAHSATPTELDATHFGWSDKDGKLDFTWFSGNQLPELSDVILHEPTTESASTTEEDIESDIEWDSDSEESDFDDSDAN